VTAPIGNPGVHSPEMSQSPNPYEQSKITQDGTAARFDPAVAVCEDAGITGMPRGRSGLRR
jgi:hypothetical protein